MNLPPFKLERYFARYEFNVEYLLCASDCQSFTVQELLSLEPDAAARFGEHWLGYTESPGSPSLRQEIAGIYTGISPEQILVHSGAEEAIFLLMHAILGPGDHAIVHFPCYQSLIEVARGTGCDVSPWTAHEGDAWALDLDELERLIRPETRLIVVNFPHNPTGYLMPDDKYRRLNGIAQERGIILFSDEVYREAEYNSADRLPSACEINPTAISLGVMSKTYGLPGLRIGWVATRDVTLLAKMAALKDYTTICNSAPSEFLAELALRHRPALVERNLEIIARNLSILDSFFERHADRFVWHRPKAGPIAFPRLLDGDIEAFCHDLVTTSGVLLLPGTVYEDTGNHFRIGFGRANLPEAVARLEEYLDR